MLKFEILEHKSDLQIKSFGRTKEELFENAMIGMFKAAGYRIDLESQKVKVKIKITSFDFKSLLIDFLNEILYLVETRKEVYQKVHFIEFSEKEVKAFLIGKKLKRMKIHVKAVTYNNLNIYQKKDRTWEATILFDI